ncbi:unnamed protein product [Cyprideis torosa]|uniref:Peptidase M1 membrane alanine aminopeptidase domain-containing protein n=1 Tax=Cyprideis torosa TaxID=163714 RepID=A0A7R8WKQ1_9CRUS|nr:unnamed protein product [Cyprideis torosa]CAG0901614.1 unnamed protein product [Cyprideis torosa]
MDSNRNLLRAANFKRFQSKCYRVAYFIINSLLSEATLALEAGAHVLQSLGQFWLNFPYPFPKMDLIAVPRHPAGAMENWGLIQFTDELFYHGPDQPVSHEKLVIEITAHELAHQWFGNLVTLEWWSQFWLNEAFTTFYSFYGAESYDNILGKFLQRLHTIGTIQGYESDVLSTSLPITADTFDEALVFPNTNIIYRKGAALHNMMLGFLGQAYYLGMRSYVRTYAYRNARNQDFLETMQEAIDAMGTSLPATFEEIMNGFLFQPGVPVVSVVRDQSTVTVRQKRFLLDGPDDGTRYMLPFKYKTSSSEESSLEWLLEDEAQLEVDFSSEDDWLLINPDHESYMIVQYDPNEYQRIFAQLESNHFVFNAVQRATIFYDLSFVIEGGLLEPDVALPILETSYLEQELDEIAWFGILRLHRVLMQIEIPDYEEVFLSKAQVALDRAIELSNNNPPHPNFYDVVIELLETLLESKNNFQTFLESPAWTNAIGRPKDSIFQRRMSQIL